MKPKKRIHVYLVISILTFLLCLTGCAKQAKAATNTITPMRPFAMKAKPKVKKETDCPSAELMFSLQPKGNQEAGFYKFYYVDQKNLLNALFWQYSLEPHLHYTSAWCYQEQTDGKVEESEITWNSDLGQKLNSDSRGAISVQSQWKDEKTGDFYFIVCNWTFDSDDNPNYLYGIHSNGELFLQKKLEDELIMNKIEAGIFSPGLRIDYLGQENGVAYFNYYDKDGYQVVYFDMAQQQFTKQISTDYTVCGILDHQYIGINDSQLYIGNIPDGEIVTNLSGKSILIGESTIKKIETLSKKDSISINGDYVYRLTDHYYMRKKLGDKDWTSLADVSDIMDDTNDYLILCDMMSKGKDSFALAFYEDCGRGFFVNSYKIK